MTRFSRWPSNAVLFMLALFVLYGVLYIVAPTAIASDFGNAAADFVGLLPLLAFVFAVIFVVNLFLGPELIRKHLGHESGVKGWLYAFIGSIFLSAPPYVLFPMFKELREHGMKYSLIALFMNNRNVQVALLPVMVYYFGITFTVVVSVYILLFAFMNALILSRFFG